jgi:hypothetical protein
MHMLRTLLLLAGLLKDTSAAARQFGLGHCAPGHARIAAAREGAQWGLLHLTCMFHTLLLFAGL